MSHGRIPALVPSLRPLLAAGPAGADPVSDHMGSAAAVPPARHRRARCARSGLGSGHAPRAVAERTVQAGTRAIVVGRVSLVAFGIQEKRGRAERYTGNRELLTLEVLNCRLTSSRLSVSSLSGQRLAVSCKGRIPALALFLRAKGCQLRIASSLQQLTLI